MYWQLQQIECPKCKGHFRLRRAQSPRFDRQGFESYQFDCKFCGASLIGIVDPSDGALLVQQEAFPGRLYSVSARKHPQERPLAAALRTLSRIQAQQDVLPALCEMRNVSLAQVWAGAFVGRRQSLARSLRVHLNRNMIAS
jgi:hypothetical protein